MRAAADIRPAMKKALQETKVSRSSVSTTKGSAHMEQRTLDIGRPDRLGSLRLQLGFVVSRLSAGRDGHTIADARAVRPSLQSDLETSD